MAAKTYKIDFKVEKAQFESKLKKLVEVTGKKSSYWAKEGAAAFLQATVKATPVPPKGIRRPPKIVTNDVLVPVTKGTINNRPIWSIGKGKKATSFYVPFRTKYNQGWKWFKTKPEAKEFAFIRNRGLSKWAWVVAGNMARLAVAYGYKFNNYVQRHRRFGKGMVTDGFFKNSVVLINSIDGIREYGEIAAKIGMRRAKNRIGFLLKEAKKEQRRIWQG